MEALLATCIFGVFAVAFTGAFLYGEESTALAGNTARGALLAEEGLEAVRNIRDANWQNLADGTYGLSTSGSQWALSGSQDTTGIFTRQITISTVDQNRKNITSKVTWKQNAQRNGSISLQSELTYWQKIAISTCDQYCVSLGTPPYTTGACRKKCTRQETQESGGDIYCTSQAPACCCRP